MMLSKQATNYTRGCTDRSSLLDLNVLSVHVMHSHHVVAEVKGVESFLLSQQSYDGTAGPLEPLPAPLSEYNTHTDRQQTYQVNTTKWEDGMNGRNTQVREGKTKRMTWPVYFFHLDPTKNTPNDKLQHTKRGVNIVI